MSNERGNGVGRYLAIDALRDLMAKRGTQGAGQQGGNDVVNGDHNVQLTPSSVASSNLLTALPHMLGRVLGGTQMTGGYDPKTGVYTPEAPVHSTIDSLLNGGQASAAAQLANMRQGTALSNNNLDITKMNTAQRNDMNTRAGVVSTDARDNTPTVGSIATAGIGSSANALGNLRQSMGINNVLTNPDYNSRLAAGMTADAGAPAVPNPLEVGAGGAAMNYDPTTGEPLTTATGAPVVPSVSKTEISTGMQMNPDGTFSPQKSVSEEKSQGSVGTINQTLSPDEQKQIMQSVQPQVASPVNVAPSVIPSAPAVAPTNTIAPPVSNVQLAPSPSIFNPNDSSNPTIQSLLRLFSLRGNTNSIPSGAPSVIPSSY